jgi:outer membrane receptor for ferrienterochelin and colicins
MNQNKDNLNFRINYRGKHALVDSNNNSYLDRYDKFINGHFLTNLSYNKFISKNIEIQIFIKNLLGYRDVDNLQNIPGRMYSFKLKFKK